MQLKKIKKIYLLIILLLFNSNSYSEINSKSWSKHCNGAKDACLIGITNEISLKDKNEKEILATAYIQIGYSKKKQMNLVDKEDQTYKLSEEKKSVPILFVNLPFNVDLRTKPLVQVDNTNLGNLEYLHCNNNIGCKTRLIVNDKEINFLKKGMNMSIIMGVFGEKQNLKIEFPLNGFSKAYKKLY